MKHCDGHVLSVLNVLISIDVSIFYNDSYLNSRWLIIYDIFCM